MVRDTRSPPPTPLNDDEIQSLLMHRELTFKDKTYDMDSVITRANVKKYLTQSKLNHQPEQWLYVIKKVNAINSLKSGGLDDATKEALLKKFGNDSLSEDETKLFEEAKSVVSDFLNNVPSASKSVQEKYGGKSVDDLETVQSVISSKKYKFSVEAFDVITHVVNMFVREIIIYALEECLSKKLRVVQPCHIPWRKLEDKLMAGIYFNTRTVYNECHSFECEEEVDEEEDVEEDAVEEETAVEDVSKDTETEEVDEVNTEEEKIKLRQYISTMFKVICSSEERFTGLKLSKTLKSVINDIIYQSLDRYANILTSLLHVSSSKTVNCKFAKHATEILLNDHVFAEDEQTKVVMDNIEERVERVARARASKPQVEVVVPPVTESVPVAKKQTKAKKV